MDAEGLLTGFTICGTAVAGAPCLTDGGPVRAADGAGRVGGGGSALFGATENDVDAEGLVLAWGAGGESFEVDATG